MEGIERGMEKSVTEKARVVELLKKSMAHAQAAVLATPDADLDKKVKIFGGGVQRARRDHDHRQPPP